MNFGNDQLDSTYSDTSGALNAVGPSSWMGEMSSGGIVPPGPTESTEFNYSF